MMRGDETKLFLLAELAKRGEAHGHELRREAQIGLTEAWTDVKIGSIYATLRRLESEGLIEQVRTERAGRLPERLVYRITAEGRRELRVLGDAALRAIAIPADPFDLAFSFADDRPDADLCGLIDERIVAFELRQRDLERQRRAALSYLDQRDQLLFDHLLARIDTEITWHRRVRDTLQGGERHEP